MQIERLLWQFENDQPIVNKRKYLFICDFIREKIIYQFGEFFSIDIIYYGSEDGLPYFGIIHTIFGYVSIELEFSYITECHYLNVVSSGRYQPDIREQFNPRLESDWDKFSNLLSYYSTNSIKHVL